MNNDAILGSVMDGVAQVKDGMERDRGRGYASDKESWADLKRMTEGCKKAADDIEKLLKEMWTAIKAEDPDSYAVQVHQLVQSTRDIAEKWVRVCGAAMVAEYNTAE